MAFIPYNDVCNMKTQRVKRFEVTVFMASVDEITGDRIDMNTIKGLVQDCQDGYGAIYPARISENVYVSGREYEENGYQITVTALDWLEARVDHKSLLSFAGHLAQHMLQSCNQTRVCLSDEFTQSMTTFYNENIEEKNECKI